MKPATADNKYKIYCIRIEALRGVTVYLTSYPRNLTMNGHVYTTDAGYQFTGQNSEAGLSAGMMDLSGIVEIGSASYDQIVAGVFDNARVYAFATTWNNPVEDEEPLGLAFVGKITLKDARFSAELMMLIDVLNQSVGLTYTASCPKKFGGQEFAGCKVVLADITVTGTLTHVTDNSNFRDSARTEALDYFGEGTIAFTSGANAGMKPMEIKTYLLDGSITVFEAFHYPVAVGDAYTMTPGCRKRLAEDCRDKWGNVLNFGGFPTIPTGSQYQFRGLK